MDVSYIPMAKGFLHLVVAMGWASRAVLGWRLSNRLGNDFCVEALVEALSNYSRPENFNTDHGSRYAKAAWITISLDGRGRGMDNIFVERLWRSLKYEELYLNANATMAEAKAGIGAWLDFYNKERQHQSLSYRTRGQIYACGYVHDRRCQPAALPASRASSENEEMLAFAHIPTGTVANRDLILMKSKVDSLHQPAQ